MEEECHNDLLNVMTTAFQVLKMNHYSFPNFHEAAEKFITTNKLKGFNCIFGSVLPRPVKLEVCRSFHVIETWKTFNVLTREKSVHDFQKLMIQEIHTQKPLPVEKKINYLPEKHRNICA